MPEETAAVEMRSPRGSVAARAASTTSAPVEKMWLLFVKREMAR